LEADGLKSSLGKLLVYAPKTASCRKRLMVVKAAVEKTAKALNMDFEIVSFKGNTPIYVYYEGRSGRPCAALLRRRRREKPMASVQCPAEHYVRLVIPSEIRRPKEG